MNWQAIAFWSRIVFRGLGVCFATLIVLGFVWIAFSIRTPGDRDYDQAHQYFAADPITPAPVAEPLKLAWSCSSGLDVRSGEIETIERARIDLRFDEPFSTPPVCMVVAVDRQKALSLTTDRRNLWIKIEDNDGN